MPERYTPPNEKDDSDSSDNGPEKPAERRPNQPAASPAAESKPWWQEAVESRPPVPMSQEVQRYAAERQARLVTELSLDEKDKDKESEKGEEDAKSKQPEPEQPTSIIEPRESEATPEPTESEKGHEAVVQEIVSSENAEAEAAPEPTAEELEAAKEIARERLEAHEAAEDDPVADYLEKITVEGDPAEAEQETIKEHELDEVQAEADLLLWELEDLLEKAADKVGDKDLSDEEMMELAVEMAPDIEATGPEEPPNIESFAPEPRKLPDITTLPDISKPDRRTPITQTKHHRYQAPSVNPTLGSGGHPPVMPPPGGGGGGGSGGGAERFTAAAGVVHPNLQPVWQGLSSAERAKLRRKDLTTALLAGLIGYYIGRHFGKAKGRAEAESELRPELQKQAKINERQDHAIIAGQKRIDSLKRIKDAQQQETYERERRERLTPSPEKAAAATKEAERPGQPSVETVAPTAAASSIASEAGSPERAKQSQHLKPERFQPELPDHRLEHLHENIPIAEHAARVEAEPERPLQRPELSTEQLARIQRRPEAFVPPIPETKEANIIGPAAAPELAEPRVAPTLPSETTPSFDPEAYRHQPAETAPIYEPSQEAERVTAPPVPNIASVETSSLYVPPLSAERSPDVAESIESPATSAELVELQKSQTAESLPSAAPRFGPEIPTYTPGIEAPTPTSAPEALVPSIGEEHISPAAQPESLEASAIEAMNLPELVTVAKEMTVGGENLGQMFQEKRIDATGLRRVAAEYARGGNPESLLDQERKLKEIRRESPEFLHSEPAASSADSVGTQGGGAGLFAEAAAPKTDHLLPAYDPERYPSSTPQHLLPAYDQETVTKRHHRTVAVASALIGAGAGIILGLILL